MNLEQLRDYARIVFSNSASAEQNDLLASLPARQQADPDSALTRLIAGRVFGIKARQAGEAGDPEADVLAFAQACLEHYDKATQVTGPDPDIMRLIACDLAEIPPLSKQGLHLVARYGPASPDFLAHYVGAMKMLGQIEKTAADLGETLRQGEREPFGLLKGLQGDETGDALLAARTNLRSALDVARKVQDANIADGRKSCLVCSLPKSGTMFIANSLTKTLGLLNLGISVDHWPESTVVPEYAEMFAKGGAVCVDHIDPSARNLDALKDAGMRRAWVHVRDPRQASVSWFHHIRNNLIFDHYFFRHFENPPIPEEYDDWPEFRQKAWIADTFFVQAWRWVSDWWDTQQADNGFTVAFSQQERLRDGPVRTVNDILTFFGNDARLGDSDLAAPRDGALHFRKGATDEWRTFFDAGLRERMWAAMNERPEISAHFGWEA